ncbi:MAG: S9 family peptidase [Planctomycetota bacterium]|nr:S9 family peptidase [Planctomycetota bacterium]
MLNRIHVAFGSVVTVLSSAFADPQQKPDASLLTLQRVYGSTEFATQSDSAHWMPTGSAYVKLQTIKPGIQNIAQYDAQTGRRTVMVSSSDLTPSLEEPSLSIHGFTMSDDGSKVLIYTNSKRVWRRKSRGDYWVFDRSSRDLRKLGGDAAPSTLMFAKFSPSADRVAYVRDNNIYVEDLLSDDISQLTKSDSETIINGTFDWVYEEELGLRDGFRFSPDGRSIAYWQIDTEGVSQFPLVDNTAGLYPRAMWFAYPKTGQRNSACRVGVVDLRTRNTTWLPVPGDPRNHYIARMDWAKNSHEIILQQLNRLQNTNRVMVANTRDVTVETILTERDDAWVDIHDEFNWLDDGKRFTWISERSGWRQIDLVSRDGREVRQLIPSRAAKFDVIRLLHVDEKLKRVYFLASPDHPTQQYLYAVQLDGTGLRRITPEDSSGTHGYEFSPDGRFAIHTSSTFSSPPVTQIVGLPDHNAVRTLVDNQKLKDKLAKLKRPESEFFRVEIGNGVELDAWCLKPPRFDASKKYPVLVYVYGEPAGQTVLDRWRGSSGLWHEMLAQRGYIVMSFDNRGTPAARGRAWRKCVYRQVGIMAPQDQAAALTEVLRKRPYLDRGRVGIWGWSGGGSSSLHAIFKYPELYHTAISIAPVPNQRYYDTIYQERYMGLPNDNVAGYRDGSAMNFASQLKGNLLLIHGTGDDNCHYQTTEMLINELIRHNKQFDMMAYPFRTHSIREGRNTTLHLRHLMTRYLERNLPVEPFHKP